MNETYYLVDNNVLSKLTAQQRASAFLRERCRIPEEVLHEADGMPDHKALCALNYPVTTAVLELVRTVMSKVEPGNYRLIDLYKNKGNADPLLVATALDAMAATADTLMPDTWQIITDDQGLKAMASVFSVTTLSTTEFVRFLE